MIPAYNRGHLLLAAVASVQAQDYPYWEIIIADDGSTDNSIALIVALLDERIQILRMEHSGNIAMLRNAAARAGRGKWICFLDSDDCWAKDKLKIQLQMLERSPGSWCYGGFELISEAGNPLPEKTGSYIPLSGWITADLLINKASVAIGSLMLHRDRFEELNGFDCHPELIFREDYELVLRLSLIAKAIAVPQTLVYVREHAGRSTNNLVRAHERTAWMYRYFACCCEDAQLRKIAMKRHASLISEAAGRHLKAQQYGKAMRFFFKALLSGDKPRHVLSVLLRKQKTIALPEHA